MRDITATVLPDSLVTVEGNAGFVEEHNAARLMVELNDELGAEEYSYHCFCFDICGLGRKIVSNNIYGLESDSPATRSGNTLICPLPEVLTSTGELTVQIEAHQAADGEAGRIVKSGLFTIHFEPSVTGCCEPVDELCGLLPRIQAILAGIETAKSDVVLCSFAEYTALPVKKPAIFYLVDGEAETGWTDIHVTGVTLNKNTTAFYTGGAETLTAAVTPGNASNKAVFWTSSNTGVAAVSEEGVITGTGAGISTITVTTADGAFTASCAVTVTAAPGLWQGTKTVNGITVIISGGHITMNGTKTTANYALGSMYYTDNVTNISNYASCPGWFTFSSGDVITLTVKNKTGSCSASGEYLANAACQLRTTANVVLCGTTWGNPTGTFTYTFTADTAVTGLFCYLNTGAVVTDYTFDIEFSVNGARWI